MVALQEYLKFVQYRLVVFGKEVGEEKVGVKDVLLLRLVPGDIDRRSHLLAPFKVDMDEIVFRHRDLPR